MTIQVRTLVLIFSFLLAGCVHQSHSQSGYGDGFYSDAELDQMLAPIALYPDVVLSQILMASTFPRQIEEAARWSAEHPGLDGHGAVDAVTGYGWDPSVQALVAFPELLQRLAGDPAWTWRLGDAYLSQEGAVLDSVQRLRSHAYRARRLDTLEHLHIYRDGGIIIIEPARTDIVYLPYYRPHRIYGDWWWPEYPPHYWDFPSRSRSGAYLHWSRGFSVGSAFFFSGFHWHDRHIVTFDRHHYRGDGHRRYYKHYKHPQRWRHHDRRQKVDRYHYGSQRHASDRGRVYRHHGARERDDHRGRAFGNHRDHRHEGRDRHSGNRAGHSERRRDGARVDYQGPRQERSERADREYRDKQRREHLDRHRERERESHPTRTAREDRGWKGNRSKVSPGISDRRRGDSHRSRRGSADRSTDGRHSAHRDGRDFDRSHRTRLSPEAGRSERRARPVRQIKARDQARKGGGWRQRAENSHRARRRGAPDAKAGNDRRHGGPGPR